MEDAHFVTARESATRETSPIFQGWLVFLRIDQCELQTQLPSWGKLPRWSYCVVIQRDVGVHHLVTYVESPPRPTAERYQPAVPRRLRPVCAEGGSCHKIPTMRQ